LPEGEILLGRSRSCTVTLPDPSISRQHAKLMLRQGQVRLRDLNSSNGTYINDTRVQSESDVVDGDRIVLGETEMRFRAAAPEGPPLETQRVEVKAEVEEALDPPTLRRAPGIPDLAPPPASTPGPPATPAPPPRAAGKAAAGELLPSIGSIGAAPAPTPPSRAAAAVARGEATPLARPAGFWIRALAALLDALWIGALSGLTVALPFLLDVPANLASTLTVAVGALSAVAIIAGWAKWGTTPGKRLLRLYVCPPGGSPGIGVGKAILRYVGYFLSAALLGVGFLLVAFSKEKRALHDLLAGTSVVRR
jgi:pSer/pThr/pTyr-binding forkhead associated (FHA) protein/uncharacterized RDD family membrane protein YckC